jgi:hypothetical protein
MVIDERNLEVLGGHGNVHGLSVERPAPFAPSAYPC